MKTLNDRVLEAKTLAREGKITSRNNKNQIRTIIVPGSKATLNQVIIRRNDGITTECRKIVHNNGYEVCLGNLSGVCRHSLAAMFIALGDHGFIPRFRKHEQHAEKLAKQKQDIAFANPHTGKIHIFSVSSWQSKKVKPLYFIAEEI